MESFNALVASLGGLSKSQKLELKPHLARVKEALEKKGQVLDMQAVINQLESVSDTLASVVKTAQDRTKREDPVNFIEDSDDDDPFADLDGGTPPAKKRKVTFSDTGSLNAVSVPRGDRESITKNVATAKGKREYLFDILTRKASPAIKGLRDKFTGRNHSEAQVRALLGKPATNTYDWETFSTEDGDLEERINKALGTFRNQVEASQSLLLCLYPRIGQLDF